MQLVKSRIWTRVAVFISYDDNNYTIDLVKNYLYLIKSCAKKQKKKQQKTRKKRQEQTNK